MLQESCSVAPTDSHIAEGTTIEHESWLLQEVVRDLPHCLHRSIPQPESGITYGVRHFQLNALAENCLQVVFCTLHVHSSVTTRTECGMKNVKLINLSEAKYSFCYTYFLRCGIPVVYRLQCRNKWETTV
jgi:hypothetical protein